MNGKRRKALLIFLAVVLVMGFYAGPAGAWFDPGSQVYGATYVKTTLVGRTSAVQGDQDVAITVEVQNKDSASFTFDSATLELDYPNNITVSGGSTGTVTLAKGEKANLTYYLDVGRFASTGTRMMSLVLRNDGELVHENLSLGSVRIYQKLGVPSGGSGNYVAALDIIHSINPEGGFESGTGNTLNLELNNFGNTVIKNAALSLTMPEGLSVYNASNSANLGYISTGSSREVSFPITVSEDAESKNYAITVKLSGLNYTNEPVSEEKTFYIPVNGSGTSVRNAEISNISVPGQVAGDDEFTLSFDVTNNNSAELKNVKVNVEVPDGLLNKSKSTFIEASLPGGSRKSYDVTLFAGDGAKEKTYTIKITLSGSSGTSESSVTQYASVYVSGVTGEKTPQLMVDSYSYGGSFVQAGDEFPLELYLYNTSGSRSISNIKITISSEDGAIIPVNSSNSFFIEKLGKKERTRQAMLLSVKPAAEQKTTPLTVEMSYEDGSGNAFTSKDIISIPVMQETRLEVDDIIAPPELFPGMQTGLSVQFYNTGKTTLNNLRVTAEGDFDTEESTSYFVGNLESGKSDSYDFGFIPRQGGAMEGKVIFSYEDASGEVQILERAFSFDVMEEMPVFDEEMMPDEGMKEGGGKAPWIAAGVILLLGGGGVFAWRIIRKKKMHREMEIDE